jgi:hypothetical protein
MSGEIVNAGNKLRDLRYNTMQAIDQVDCATKEQR